MSVFGKACGVAALCCLSAGVGMVLDNPSGPADGLFYAAMFLAPTFFICIGLAYEAGRRS